MTQPIYLVIRKDSVDLSQEDDLADPYNVEESWENETFVDHAFTSKKLALKYLQKALIAQKNDKLCHNQHEYTIDFYIVIVKPENKVPNTTHTENANYDHAPIEYEHYDLDKNNQLTEGYIPTSIH